MPTVYNHKNWRTFVSFAHWPVLSLPLYIHSQISFIDLCKYIRKFQYTDAADIFQHSFFQYVYVIVLL